MTDTHDPSGSDADLDPYAGLDDLTEGEPLPVLEDPDVPAATPPRSPLLTGLIVALLLVVLSIAFFQLLRQDDDSESAAATTTTEAPGGEETTPPTTEGNGAEPTEPPAETTVAPPAFDPYPPVGEAIPVEELTLAVDSIGSIALGSPAADSVGQLISSLGEPDEDSGPVISNGTWGTCEGDTERTVRLGALVAVVVVDENGAETFAGYRLDLAYGGLNSPSVDMATLSGLKAGDSVRRLQQIYEGFDVQILTDAELGDIFELRSANTGNLLLWGPVSSPEPNGFVRGIYAPDACDRF